jgi:superfamily II DNA/RNA helicase
VCVSLTVYHQKVLGSLIRLKSDSSHRASTMVCVGNRESNEERTWNPLRLMGIGVQIVLGTPASIWNAIDRRALRTGDIDTFVLEEAHELLCEGYRYEIHDVITYLRKNAQIVMISGTRPPLSADVHELEIYAVSDDCVLQQVVCVVGG